MKIFIATYLLLFLFCGCSIWDSTEYTSEIIIVPQKTSGSDSDKIFNINVNLTKKTGDNIKIIKLPPLIVTYQTKDMAWTKTDIEGVSIKYSVNIKERQEEYDLLHYKLDIIDNATGYHEEKLIPVNKEDKIVKSIAPEMN